MRILIVNTLYPPMQHGGAEKSVALLAEGLVKSGDEVAVLTLHSGRAEAFEILKGVRVYRMPLDNIYWPFRQTSRPRFVAKLLWHSKDLWNTRAAARIGRVIDLERPEVVHTNGVSGFSVAAFAEVKRRNLRLVHTLRDFYLLCKNSAFFREGRTCHGQCAECRIFTTPRKWASSRADAVVSISQYVLNAHRNHGYFDRIPSSVIYNIAGFASKPSDVHSEAGSQTLVFGYLGRVEKEKGIEVLLEATRKLPQGNWRLRVGGVGEEVYVANLKHRFVDPRIEWLGFADAQRFYKSIDVAIIPSIWPEPLGRAVIEAFAARKSAICARSGGIPEIASLGKIVETYSANDIDALADLMSRALKDVCRWRQGGYNDEAAQELFTEAHVVNRYRAVYSSRQ